MELPDYIHYHDLETEELFIRLFHIIKNQILHRHLRNLTEPVIGVAKNLNKGAIHSTLVDDFHVTVIRGLTLPLSCLGMFQNLIRKHFNVTLAMHVPGVCQF